MIGQKIIGLVGEIDKMTNPFKEAKMFVFEFDIVLILNININSHVEHQLRPIEVAEIIIKCD